MRCSFKRLIFAPPLTVWRIMTDLPGAPDLFPQYRGWSITYDPRGADLVALSHYKVNRGGDTEYVVRLTEREVGRVIEADYLEPNLTPMDQTVTYTLDPQDEGSRLYVVLDVKGLVGFTYMFFVIRQYLNRLKEVAEGEHV